jgi:hypothetical protein
MLNAFRSYLAVNHHYSMSQLAAFKWVLVIISLATIGTVLIGLPSALYLMPSGAYCFFDFGSPVIVAWFIPILVSLLLPRSRWSCVIHFLLLVCLVLDHCSWYCIIQLYINLSYHSSDNGSCTQYAYG